MGSIVNSVLESLAKKHRGEDEVVNPELSKQYLEPSSDEVVVLPRGSGSAQKHDDAEASVEVEHDSTAELVRKVVDELRHLNPRNPVDIANVNALKQAKAKMAPKMAGIADAGLARVYASTFASVLGAVNAASRSSTACGIESTSSCTAFHRWHSFLASSK